MKSKLNASILSFCALSLSAVAYADAGNQNGKATGTQEEHASAVGKPEDPAKVTHTINVDMNDAMRFSPAKLTVKRGETVKFVVKNPG
jgi:uncharacterized cupredoxin-like copper-binding protein